MYSLCASVTAVYLPFFVFGRVLSRLYWTRRVTWNLELLTFYPFKRGRPLAVAIVAVRGIVAHIDGFMSEWSAECGRPVPVPCRVDVDDKRLRFEANIILVFPPSRRDQGRTEFLVGIGYFLIPGID